MHASGTIKWRLGASFFITGQRGRVGHLGEDFVQRLHRIYGDAVAPDSQSIIDEGRGDR